MADRTITARLRLVIDEYVKGARQASKETKGIGDETEKTGKRTSGSWQKLGKATSDLGSSMTSKVTLPIVALGAASVKMAMDFNGAFDQMAALAGVSGDEIDGLKESVLGLSETTGRGPKELAEALYFIRGAGLSGQTALDALEVSARAAASGLGTTIEVADALTNVLNAYGASNISAAEAGDILVASVTAAKVEASEMAPQFGRLLPVAAELGVGFGDVAGALAFLTVSSGDASQASTGLGGVLRKLLQPSTQGAAALEQIGMKAFDLRDMLGKKGLDGTIQELRKRMGDSGFKQLFDDSEALSAALQMTGESADQFSGIMDDTNNASGALDEAFKKTDNDTRKMQITWAKAQGAMIRFGDAILPIVTMLADLASAALGVLGGMPDELRTAIVLFGGLLAASGPVLKIFGSLTTNISKMSGWLEKTSAASGRFGGAMSKLPSIASGVATALGAIGVALVAIEIIAGQRESRTRGWVEDMVGDPGTLDEVRSSIQRVKRELDVMDNEEGKHRLFSVGDNNVFATSGDADRQEKIDQTRERLAELEAQEESLVGQEEQTAAAYVGTDGALEGLNEETSNAVNELQAYSDALTAQFDPLFGMMDALHGNEEAQAAVTEAQKKLNDILAAGGEGSTEAAAAQAELEEAQRQATGSALDLTAASDQLSAGIEAGTVNVVDAKAQLATWVSQGLITQSTADAMARKFDIAALKAAILDGVDPAVDVSTTGLSESGQKVKAFQDQLDRLPWVKHVTIDVSVGGAVGQALSLISQASNHAGGGPLAAGEVSWVGENGPELLVMGQQPGHVYNQSQLAAMSTSGRWTSGGAFGGGGGGVVVHVDMRGSVVADRTQFQRMVSSAWNKAAKSGLVNVNGKRLATA